MPVDGAISEPMISQVTYSGCSALNFWRSDSDHPGDILWVQRLELLEV